MRRLTYFLTSAFILASLNANAIEPIPEETGWSGLINLGVGTAYVKSNMIAGIDLIDFSTGSAKIDSLAEDPKSETSIVPQVNLNFKYTFSSQTQLFFGNSLEDILTFDTAAVAGVRQQFSDRSILEFGLVATPFFAPIQVWSDPYAVGVERQETDRVSTGARLEYANILGSGFGAQLTHRTTKLDDELSGTTQSGLTPSEAALLNREGDVGRLAAYYRFKPINRNIFEFRLARQQDDLDGDAMAGDRNEIKLTHAYFGKRFITAGNVFVAQKDFDEVNPVFGKTREDDLVGVGLVFLDKKLFRREDLFAQVTAVWVDMSSNIDFYDTNTSLVAVGAQYRF